MDYDPQEHLESLQVALIEAEQELDDPYLLAEDRRHWQALRKSLKQEIAQITQEITAMEQMQLFSEAGPTTLIKEVANDRLEYSQTFNVWKDANKEERKAILATRMGLVGRLAVTANAPGQLKQDRGKAPVREWIGELCLFGAAKGWNIREVLDLLGTRGVNIWSLQGFDWKTYDYVRDYISEHDTEKPLGAREMGLPHEPDMKDYMALVEVAQQFGKDQSHVNARLKEHGVNVSEVGWKAKWTPFIKVYVELTEGKEMQNVKEKTQEAAQEDGSELFASAEADGLFAAEGGSDASELFAESGDADAEQAEIREALGIKEGWMPQTKEEWDYINKKFDMLDYEEKCLEAQHQVNLNDLNARREWLKAKYEPGLREYVRCNHDPKKKSIRFSTSTVGFSPKKEGYVIKDKSLLLGWLMQQKPEVLSELKAEKYTAVKYEDLNVLKEWCKETGEVIPGLEHQEAEEYATFTRKVAAK